VRRPRRRRPVLAGRARRPQVRTVIIIVIPTRSALDPIQFLSSGVVSVLGGMPRSHHRKHKLGVS
jgi:hypothetical protein